MKKVVLFLVLGLFFLFFPIGEVNAFVDLRSGDLGYSEVSFLTEASLLSGTEVNGEAMFMGERAITRCEFLKVLITTQYRPLKYKKTSTIFSDIPREHWCYEFADFAVSNGIAQGVGGAFSPDKPINRSEALKMMFEYFEFALGVPSQQLFIDVIQSDWMFPYVNFASSYRIDESEDAFLPFELLSRTQASILLYRSLWVVNYKAPYDDSYVLKRGFFDRFKQTQALLESSTISKDSFEGISLDFDLPTTFQEGALYALSGRVANIGGEGKVSALLYNTFTQEGKLFQAEVVGNSFKVLVSFPQKGIYEIDILNGLRQGSDSQQIAVRERVQEYLPVQKFENPCIVSFENTLDGNVHIVTDSSYDYEMQIVSGSFQKKFYFESLDRFQFPYSELWGWPQGEMSFSFQGRKETEAGESTCRLVKNVSSVVHQFSEYNYMDTSVSKLSHYAQVGDVVSWNGKSSEPLKSKMAIIKPDGFTEEIPLVTDDLEELKPQTHFNATYSFQQKGAYRIEINHINGAAEVNYPVYVGDVYPLIPDFEDIRKSYLLRFVPGTLDEMRQKVLKWVNSERGKLKLKEVILDPTLNSLAQGHTDDMVKRDYFGHASPDGENISDRVKKARIMTSVGENLASGFSLRHAYEGLLYSAIHRENLLDSEWNTLGIGVTIGADGVVRLAQEFSYKIFTPQNEGEVEMKTMDFINSLRRENGMRSINTLSGPQGILNEWSEKIRDLDSVDTALDNTSLVKNIQKAHFNTVTTVIVLKINNVSSLEEEVRSLSEVFLKKNIHFVSLASAVDSNGIVFISIALFD